jgi:hypothetical protein
MPWKFRHDLKMLFWRVLFWPADKAGARSGAVRSLAQRPGHCSGYGAMTTNVERNLIKAKVGGLELAKQLALDDLSAACQQRPLQREV